MPAKTEALGETEETRILFGNTPIDYWADALLETKIVRDARKWAPSFER